MPTKDEILDAFAKAVDLSLDELSQHHPCLEVDSAFQDLQKILDYHLHCTLQGLKQQEKKETKEGTTTWAGDAMPKIHKIGDADPTGELILDENTVVKPQGLKAKSWGQAPEPPKLLKGWVTSLQSEAYCSPSHTVEHQIAISWISGGWKGEFIWTPKCCNHLSCIDLLHGSAPIFFLNTNSGIVCPKCGTTQPVTPSWVEVGIESLGTMGQLYKMAIGPEYAVAHEYPPDLLALLPNLEKLHADQVQKVTAGHKAVTLGALEQWVNGTVGVSWAKVREHSNGTIQVVICGPQNCSAQILQHIQNEGLLPVGVSCEVKYLGRMVNKSGQMGIPL